MKFGNSIMRLPSWPREVETFFTTWTPPDFKGLFLAVIHFRFLQSGTRFRFVDPVKGKLQLYIRPVGERRALWP